MLICGLLNTSFTIEKDFATSLKSLEFVKEKIYLKNSRSHL